jgi:hypothetical protein
VYCGNVPQKDSHSLKPLTVAISQGRDMWEIFLFSKVQKRNLPEANQTTHQI